MTMKWYKVKVNFVDEVYFDEILGFNREDALKRASWNWPEAVEVEIVTVED